MINDSHFQIYYFMKFLKNYITKTKDSTKKNVPHLHIIYLHI